MKDTRQLIIDAAITIFNNDYSAALDVIAEKAGVHRRTLHLYFKSRQELIDSCKSNMLATCKQAMTEAYNASSDPVKQLELMLYAGIDCGVKYSFLNKLYGNSNYAEVPEAEKNGTFDTIKHRWFKIIEHLQNQQIISNQLPVAWIFTLFSGMITNAIDAGRSGDIAPNSIKNFAWYSFSKGIGLK